MIMSEDRRILIIDDEPNIRLDFHAALAGPDRPNVERQDVRDTSGACRRAPRLRRS
ncbi:MAG: hypothetical protein JO355_00820 [Planctomycetaceae bacterium]|nr:hypothetical protein [Planctomycetaceae bacterium]MBV8610948.1 hypothetical protein [Singulisphaera sp.]MBV8675691.1 hypothetical protein [Planctomycetaceae bacterium]